MGHKTLRNLQQTFTVFISLFRNCEICVELHTISRATLYLYIIMEVHSASMRQVSCVEYTPPVHGIIVP